MAQRYIIDLNTLGDIIYESVRKHLDTNNARIVEVQRDNNEKALSKDLQRVISGNKFQVGKLQVGSSEVPYQYYPSDQSFTISLHDLVFPFSLNNYTQSVDELASSIQNFVSVFFSGTDTRNNTPLAPLSTNVRVQGASTPNNTTPISITPSIGEYRSK